MYVFIHALCYFFALLIFTYFIYIVFHLLSWSRHPPVKISTGYAPKTRISIIIAARNEELTIGKCLASIASQSYPAELLEIIVVDDHSTDKTIEVVKNIFLQMHIPGKCISTREKAHGKKSALTEGIKHSSGELLVITDADCSSGKNWLVSIESEYKKTGAYMLCGPVEIISNKGIIGIFQSLELCGLSLLSGAGIHAGVPLLCNGANLAYTRKVFDDVEGFKDIDNNPSGDDILLMFKIHHNYSGKIGYVKSTDAIVSTYAQDSIKAFLLQRIRWASKGLYSKNRVNSFVSLLVFASNFLSLAAILFSAIFEKIFPLIIPGIALKITADFLLLLFGTSFFRKKTLLWTFPISEIITIAYVSWVGIAANFSSYSWKDRHYKRPLQ